MSWHKEPRRHSLARRGVKTATKNTQDRVMKKEKPIKTIRMIEVEEANKKAGRYWFSPKSLEFFDSEYGGTAYLKKGSDKEGFFISSEKAPTFRGVSYPRKYTIRKFNLKTGKISDEGEFQAYNTEKQAEKQMMKILEGN